VFHQVYNKWQDDSDSIIASGALPLQQVLQLSQVDHPATAEAQPCSHTFLVPLQLQQGSAEAAVQQQEAAVLLQVTVSYCAENRYSLEDGEVQVLQEEQQQQQQQQQEEAEEEPQPQQQQQHSTPESGTEQRHQQHEDAAFSAVDAVAAGGETTSPSLLRHLSSSSSSSEASGGSDSELEDLAAALHSSPLGTAATAEAAAAAVAAAAHGGGGGFDQQLSAAAKQAVPAAEAEAAAEPQPLQAALCVEVIRACGLQVSLDGAVHRRLAMPTMRGCGWFQLASCTVAVLDATQVAV
jgi:hypothetical protein